MVGESFQYPNAKENMKLEAITKIGIQQNQEKGRKEDHFDQAIWSVIKRRCKEHCERGIARTHRHIFHPIPYSLPPTSSLSNINLNHLNQQCYYYFNLSSPLANISSFYKESM